MKFIYRNDLSEDVNDLRWFAFHNDMNRFKNKIDDILIKYFDKSFEYKINIESIFKEIYLYSCLCNFWEGITLLNELYDSFDPFEKIALKPVLTYGKYLTRK